MQLQLVRRKPNPYQPNTREYLRFQDQFQGLARSNLTND
jgi:hypothetical protein